MASGRRGREAIKPWCVGRKDARGGGAWRRGREAMGEERRRGEAKRERRERRRGEGERGDVL
uniref:Uncharacterized protein n=1 Tax=Leersia perrieri TaxID=77586 RepID=A0A0D9VTD2_9ORYZ